MTKADVAAERKRQIVRATVECMTKHGYHNFSMQDVARSAGVSKGIIHYYFLNKDELMISVLEKVAADIEAVLISEMKNIDDPQQKLDIFVRGCLNIVRNTREYYQVNMDFWTQINQKQEVKNVIARHYEKFRMFCVTILNEGVSKKIFKAIDTDAYSSFIIAVIDGISIQWLFDETALDYEKTSAQMSSWILKNLELPDK